MNKNRNSIIFIFFLMLISVFIICCVKYFGKNSCFNDDDFFYARYMLGESYFDSFKFSLCHGGGYLGLFLCKFLSFGLPCLLNIHPDDFICNQAGIIRGIFTCFILMSISLFSIFYNKSKLLYLFSFLFIIFYYFNCEFNYFTSLVNYNFYRYFFSLLFFSVFWYFICSNILKDKKETKKNYFELFLVCLCGFIVGTSSEIDFFVSAALIILIVIYNLINKKNKFNLNINFYLPMIFLFISMVNFILSPGFKEVAATRGMADIVITFDMVKEYTNLYLDVCFFKNVSYWIVFIILLILSIIICFRKKTFKNIILPIFFQISILTVMYSLILCGKTFGVSDYFLCHHNIVFLYKMLILYPIIILFDFVIKNIYETIRYKKEFLWAVCLVILISVICININFINKIKIHSKIFYDFRKEMPKIPQSFIFDLPLDSEIHSNLYKNSLSKIYKDNDYMKINFIIVPNGLKVFSEDGGKFSEEELRELKFSKLYDDDFVLGKHD